MGIQGLFTFVQKRDSFFTEENIQKCHLIIDGNNFLHHLYEETCGTSDLFGGDYDNFAAEVNKYLEFLLKCGITPIIVVDGGFDRNTLSFLIKKYQESLKRVVNWRYKKSCLKPILLWQLFVDLASAKGVTVIRSNFKPDTEISLLAKFLKCPVVSNNSDFYFLNVKVIRIEQLTQNLKHNKNYMACHVFNPVRFLTHFGGLDEKRLVVFRMLVEKSGFINKYENFFRSIRLPCCGTLIMRDNPVETLFSWLSRNSLEKSVEIILSHLSSEDKPIFNKDLEYSQQLIEMDPDSFFEKLGLILLEEKKGYDKVDVANSSKDMNSFPYIALYSLKESPQTSTEKGSASDILQDKIQSDNIDILTESISNISLVKPIEEKGDESVDKYIDLNSIFPTWFMKGYRCGFLTPHFVDLAVNNKYFLNIIAEDYSDSSCHQISIDLIKASFSIVTGNKGRTFKLVHRFRKTVEIQTLDRYPQILPSLQKIPNLSVETRRNDLLRIVREGYISVKNFPKSWHLYILSIKYWIKKSKPKMAHVYALTMSLLILNVVDGKMGRVRKLEDIQEMKCSNNTLYEFEENSDLKPIINKLEWSDCAAALLKVLTCFQVNEKVRLNLSYSARTVHSFAKFQSAYFHIMTLNHLLGSPFEHSLMSEFFNGTFIYNLTILFETANNLTSCVNALLNNPPILELFNLCITLICDEI